MPKNGVSLLNSESQLERTYNHLGDKPLGISVSHFIDGGARRHGVLDLNKGKMDVKVTARLFLWTVGRLDRAVCLTVLPCASPL